MQTPTQQHQPWYRSPQFFFAAALLFLCLGYLVLEAFYICRIPLSVDEYNGFSQVERLRHELPYRDHNPYKTVLGYYLQLIPTLFAANMWAKLLGIKFFLAGLTSLTLLFSAFLLRKIFSYAALVTGLALLLCMSTFLERSAELRVDMLTSLWGLLSLVFLLRKRIFWSALWAALSFLVSQKGAFFVVSGFAALGAGMIWTSQRKQSIKDFSIFAIVGLAALGVYFGFWSLVAPFDGVTHTVFGPSVKRMALKQLYDADGLRMFWIQTIKRNPMFYLLGLLSLGRLFAQRYDAAKQQKNQTLFFYGASMLALCLWYKQPWPYFIVLLLPTWWILIVDLLDSEISRDGKLRYSLLALLLLTGIVFPLQRAPVVLAQRNDYQKQNIEIATAILKPGDNYMALVPMFPYQTHRPKALRWLDLPRMRHIASLPPKKKKAILAELREHPPKLVLQNGRFPRLSPSIKRFFKRNYRRFHGSVFLYQLTIKPDTGVFDLPFEGNFKVAGRTHPALIDGKEIKKGKSVFLKKGTHSISASQERTFLRFAPQKLDHLLKPEFKKGMEFFPEPYRY